MAESAATGLMMGAVFIFIDVSNYVDQQKVRSRTKGLQRIFTRLLIKHVCRYHIFVHMNDKKKRFLCLRIQTTYFRWYPWLPEYLSRTVLYLQD